MTDNYTNRKTLYLDGPGRRLSIDNHTYIATIDRSEPIASIPAEQLESVICVGPVSISAGARERLLRDQVSAIFLSTTHRYLGGHFSSSLHDSTRLVAQVNSTADPRLSVGIARSIVRGKIINMRTLLTRFSREDRRDEVAPILEQLTKIADDLERFETSSQLMGAEGAATAAYYEGWRALLPDDTTFTRRIRRPAPDPVNALLSLGGSLLTGLSVAALLQARLVPTLSYLHALDGARPSLAFDLMEEFRAPIVEQLALELLRRSSLSTESFESSEDGGVLLTREGRRVYFTALEARLGDTFNAPHLARTLSYRDAINAQAEHLSRVIRGVDPCYIPIEWST